MWTDATRDISVSDSVETKASRTVLTGMTSTSKSRLGMRWEWILTICKKVEISIFPPANSVSG